MSLTDQLICHGEGLGGGSGQTTWETREDMQTHHVHRVNPGVRGLPEGAELLLVGIDSGDVKPGRDRCPVRGTQP